MKKEIPLLILLVLIVLLLTVLSYVSFLFSQNSTVQNQKILLTAQNNLTYSKANIVVGGKTLTVDLADDPMKRTQGLSGRDSLAEDEGMLFVFETSGEYGFWMKDMNFSIDIIWIDEAGRIVHIEKSLSPSTYPQAFTPDKPAKYVLEVQSGFSQKQNLKVGDKILLPEKF